MNALVCVYLSQLVFVAAFEPPEFTLAEAVEDRAVDVALDHKLVVLLQG